MNRILNISLLGCCAALTLASCALKEQELAQLHPVYEEFYACTEAPDANKTIADSQYRVLWNEDDRISIFNLDTYNQQYRFNGETGDNSGTFSIVPSTDFITANPVSAIYAVYPYAEGTKISNDEILSVSLPSTQTWVQDSFGPGANLMVAAVHDNKLMFKNAGGILSFKLYGADASISSLLLKSNGGETLSGKASVTMSVGGLPALTMDRSASDEVTLSCTSPVALNADASDYTEFWFVLPPVTLSSGFTLTVTSPNGGTFTKSSTKPLTISRNAISRMAPIEVKLTGGAAVQPSNEIWYTSTDGEIVTPFYGAQRPFGERTLISNTYSDGKGVIVLDGDLITIGVNAFSAFEKKNLESISFPPSLVTINDCAFSYCSNLSSISFNDGLQSIGDYAFECCSSLDNVFVPSSVTTLGSGVFMECTGLSRFEGPYATDDGRFLIIGDTAYGFAPKGIVNVTIPENVRVIAPALFQWCYDIKKVQLPSQLVEIGSHAFYWTFIEEFSTLPESLETIGGGAFICFRTTSFKGKFASEDGRFLVHDGELKGVACYGMEKLVIPEGVTALGAQVITGFGIKKLVLPASLETIKTYAISQCSNLTELTVLAQTVPNGSPNLADKTQLIYVPASSVEDYKSSWSTYADRIRAIPEEAQPNNEIWYTSTDGNIVIPNNTDYFGANIVSNTYMNGKGVICFDSDVTMIGDESIHNSTYAPFSDKSTLLTVQLPETVEKIGFCAFYDCNNLCEIRLPKHLSFCGSSILENSAISSLYFPETDNINGNPVYLAKNLMSFSGPYASSDGRLLVRNNVVLSFAPAGITSYSIPEGITEIGSRGFSNSTELISLAFPSTLTIIGAQSFVGCRSLSSIIIPESVTKIEVSAFHSCYSLESVYIPQGTYLSSGVFDQCRSLRLFSGHYASSDGRCLIDRNRIIAFAPAGLTEYTIPDGVTSVDYGFDGLKELQTLILPYSVKSIRFIRGSAMKNIYCLATDAPTVSYSWSYNFPEIEAIYVPAESVEAYKSAQNWNSYSDIIQPLAAVPEAVDLGLPSGLKWASFNLGATSAEGVGNFFAWGEVLPKNYYYWDNYKWGTYTALTKYNSDESLGIVDNLRELELSDDAAHTMLGGAWRMPTHDEQRELRSYCTWTVTTVNGIDGYLVSSKSNSNSIFLPITGTASKNVINDTGEGYYWSSSLTTFSTDLSAAWFRLYLPGLSSTHSDYGSGRCNGLVIRPVCN